MRKIAVIGGGASGLVAAIAAARSNPDTQITIYEKKDTVGKKILATGNGRCNLTNKDMTVSCFRSDNPPFVENVLSMFGYEDTIRLFASLGLITKSRGSYVYPHSDQASTVLELLKLEVQRLHIKIITDAAVADITPVSKGFSIKYGKNTTNADAVILACGGKANSKLGSDGSGYALAKAFGHTMIPVVPALVQLKVKNHPFAKAAGVRTDAVVTAICDGHEAASDHGELQLTAYGISGIPVFQISRFIAKALYKKQTAKVKIDFLPDLSHEQFQSLLLKRKKGREHMVCADYLLGIFHQKLIPRFLEQARIRMHTPAGELTETQIKSLVQAVKDNVVLIETTNGFENAQVCAGGISTKEIHAQTMESRYIKNLYLTGELLDVDGICGGYNLQWAWATGYLAGTAAAANSKEKRGNNQRRSIL